MSGLPGVVWDCDGTVVDSEPIGVTTWTLVLRRYGYIATASDFAAIIGRPYETFYRYFTSRCELPDSVTLMEEYVAELFPVLRAELRVFEDARAAIEMLDDKEVPQAMASSSHRGRLDLTLEVTGLADRLAATVAGDEGKPAPLIFQTAAAARGLEPKECLAIEDSTPGALSARTAGMVVLAVVRGKRARADLEIADVVVDRLDGQAVLDMLGNLLPEVDAKGKTL